MPRRGNIRKYQGGARRMFPHSPVEKREVPNEAP